MALKIADTQFITKHDTGVAAVDVYGQSPEKQPVNTSANKTNLPSGFKTPNTKGLFDSLAKGGLSAFDSKSGQSIGNIVKGVTSVLGDKRSVSDSLKKALVSDVLSNVGFDKNAVEISGVLFGKRDKDSVMGVLSKLNPQMEVVVGGVKTIMDAGKLDSAQGIVGLISNLTGNTDLVKVLNIEPQMMVLQSLMNEATKLRIPSLIDTIISTRKEKKHQTQLLIMSAPSAASNSDLDTLSKILDTMGDSNVLKTYPDIIKSILSGYKTKHGQDPSETDANELFGLLTRIKHEWWITDRDGSKVYDLSLFENLSRHAKLALSRFDEVAVCVCVSGVYKSSFKQAKEIIKPLRPWSI